MQTAAINTESTLNLNVSNHPHKSMNQSNPLAFIPGYQSHPLPPPYTYKVHCYEEPGGVMCLEELDVLLEPDVTESNLLPFPAPSADSAASAPTNVQLMASTPESSDMSEDAMASPSQAEELTLG